MKKIDSDIDSFKNFELNDSENLTIVADINLDKDKGKEKVVTRSEKKKTHTVSRSKKFGTKSNSFLWATLGLLIAGGVFIFIDVDMGKLKTFV
ncbi:MAG: hypothetical protein KGD67_11955, partial [Candidatus Lokiarchaeota archaeon]|nr:hypothetical protein [Candidatus Lokiarchaeota archaeon]